MKWIAKRILLKSHADMDKALTQLISPFVERLRQEEDIIEWYCSKKTEEDGTKPSVRIYLNVDNSKELEILSMLDIFLRERKEIIGWTGKYNDYDPDLPNPSKSNLNQIQKGCEIALKLLKDYPESKSRSRSAAADLAARSRAPPTGAAGDAASSRAAPARSAPPPRTAKRWCRPSARPASTCRSMTTYN